jgi:hypothetical protein
MLRWRRFLVLPPAHYLRPYENMRTALTLLALLSLAENISAQQTIVYDRILLPIATPSIPGAFGSQWIADAVVHNSDVVTRAFDIDQSCHTNSCPTDIPPGQTGHILFRGEPADNPGQIMFVEHPSDLMTFESRIQDISRQAQTWGTELPVVREAAFVTRPIELLNVPTDDRFRLLLRIYDIDGRSDGRVRVSVYGFPGNGESIGDVDLSLAQPSGFHPRYKPAYAQFSAVLSLIPAGQPQVVIGVRITPLTPGLRLWAFISVTNNETQHVTTITPQ